MAMPRMQKARLLKLADFMHALKPSDGEFDMGRWGSKYFSQVETPIDLDACGGLVNQQYECRTTACLLGWATQMPAFKKAGLKMEFYKEGLYDGLEMESMEITYKGDSCDGDPCEVGEKFFGLTLAESHHLFGGGGPHNTAKEAAREIRKMVAGKLKQLRDPHYNCE